MNDLRFDTEAFVTAAAEYEDLAVKMEDLKIKLEQNIEQLTTTEWVSPASKAFMDKYQDIWAKNVMEYVTFLHYLKEMLGEVKTKYEEVAQNVEGLSFPEQ